MHQISFDLKRAHLRTVAYGEAALRGVGGMTAARFDLLCLLREKSIFRGTPPLSTGIPQRELWYRLDVDKSTVSKMLTRLEEMGWVWRARSTLRGDWRSKKVFVTPLGLQRIARAMRIMFRQRTLLSYFERIFKAAAPWKFKHIVRSLLEVQETIQFIAESFGDRSIVCYDFGPQLFEGPWDFVDHQTRRPFSPLYIPCPTPRMARPRKGPRLPTRPFEFTPYENAIRDGLWGDDKRRRRPRTTH
jgi:DNA-binding MarR family transcriptional regulator